MSKSNMSEKAKRNLQMYEWIEKKYKILLPDMKFNVKKSSILRNRAFKILHYLLTVDSINLVGAVYNLTCGNISANYAYAFSYGKITQLSNIKYFSTGPNLVSKDGEYRVGFCSVYRLKLILTAPIWKELCSYVHNISRKRKWKITVSHFHSSSDMQHKTKIMMNEFLAIAWFNELYNVHFNMTPKHTNTAFMRLMHHPEDRNKFLELLKNYSLQTIRIFRIVSSHNIIYPTSWYKLKIKPIKNAKIGQKLIPLNVTESLEAFKLNHKPWRELLISKRAGDLVINAISPNFSIIGEFFYIKGSTKMLFDKSSQYRRMEQSEVATEIVEHLVMSQNLAKKQISKRKITNWVNEKFHKLNDKISDPIKFSKREIIMSDVTLAILSEYVGHTLSNIINHNEHNMFSKSIGCPLSEKGFPMFSRYIFDICYACFCLNTKIGVIHSDLHLNNATIGKLTDAEDTHIKYIIGDTEFVLPHVGGYGCLIDFSRGIIDPDFIDLLKDKSSDVEVVDNFEEFTKTEILRCVKLYICLFPDTKDKEAELIVIFKNHFKEGFKLMTAVDMYMLCSRLKIALPEHLTEHIKLVTEITKIAERFITTEMNSLLNNKKYVDTINDMDWPNLYILKRVFANFISVDKHIDIADAFDYSNEMKYFSDKYSTYPEYLQGIKRMVNGKIKPSKYGKAEQEIRETYEKNKLIEYAGLIDLGKN